MYTLVNEYLNNCLIINFHIFPKCLKWLDPLRTKAPTRDFLTFPKYVLGPGPLLTDKKNSKIFFKGGGNLLYIGWGLKAPPPP